MEIQLRRPDDWHLHLRDGALLAAVLPHTAARFARAVVMPNLSPPVITTAAALAYRERILAARPADAAFEPLMTLYLTDATPPEEVRRARESGAVVGLKLYPAGATTHSDQGVTDIRRCEPALAAAEECGLVLQVHGEVTDPAVDVFDREKVFIERVLAPLVERFPRLKVVLEHVTTADGVNFVRRARPGVAATITPQHLLLNRNALFSGGLRPPPSRTGGYWKVQDHPFPPPGRPVGADPEPMPEAAKLAARQVRDGCGRWNDLAPPTNPKWHPKLPRTCGGW